MFARFRSGEMGGGRSFVDDALFVQAEGGDFPEHWTDSRIDRELTVHFKQSGGSV